jgi:transposase
LAQPLDQCPPTELWRGVLHLELQHLADLARATKAVEAKLDERAQHDGRVELLQSIPGVGPRTAEVIVTALDDPRRFRNSRQVASYAGLTPRRFQSGQMDRQGRISKRGNRLLRWALNQAAWMAVRYNAWARAVFQRIGAGRKERRKLAIVAVMRKLLVIAWAMLRDQRAYQPRPFATAAA